MPDLVAAWLRTGDRDRLEGAVAAVGDRIADQQRDGDRTVVLILLAMFLVVCAGWFTWSGRLARRHRAVQRALIEPEVVDAGKRRLLALVHNSADMVVMLEGDSTSTSVSPASRSVLGVEGTINDLRADPVVACWVLTLRDVTDRRALKTELAHQAFHDSLTGLANRQLFGDRLSHALHRPSGHGLHLAVRFLDLDDVKLVNDRLGHAAGDQLLIALSHRLVAVLREHDTAARLGGDEFAILLEGTDLAGATRVAEHLLEVLGEPVRLDDVTHTVRASVGIAVAEPGSSTMPELLRNADVAMYRAKDRGKGRVAVYDERPHTRSMAQLALRIELREACVAGAAMQTQGTDPRCR